jgi:hypothetical protein
MIGNIIESYLLSSSYDIGKNEVSEMRETISGKLFANENTINNEFLNDLKNRLKNKLRNLIEMNFIKFAPQLNGG